MPLFTSLLLLLQTSACVEPDTALGRRRIRAGEPACDAPPSIPDRPATAAEQARAKAAFDEIAFDGPAARWRWGFVRGSIVCGHVNGKNRLGAYTGWAPFIFDLDTGAFSIYDDRQWFYDALCAEKPSES